MKCPRSSVLVPYQVPFLIGRVHLERQHADEVFAELSYSRLASGRIAAGAPALRGRGDAASSLSLLGVSVASQVSARAPNTPHNRFVRRLLYTTAEYQPTGIPLRNQSCLPMLHRIYTQRSSPLSLLLLVRLAFTVCGLIIACCP